MLRVLSYRKSPNFTILFYLINGRTCIEMKSILGIIQVACFSYFTANLHAEENDGLYHDFIFKSSVKTVLLNIDGLELSNPVIQLNSGSQLSLHFDDLSEHPVDYNYTVILCNANWLPADVEEFDYLDGFTNDVISDYKFSFSTNPSYVHYRLKFPNSEFKITQSGNYALLVYENDDPSKVVFTKRFIVYEHQPIKLDAKIKRSGFKEGHHELQFEINHEKYQLQNPMNSVNVTVMQNFRWDNAYINEKASFLSDNKLQYAKEGSLTFPALREFRVLDIRDVNITTDKIQIIYPHANAIILKKEPIQTYAPYLFEKDINGKFIIARHEALDNYLEPDYMQVTFSLNTKTSFQLGEIYVFGGLSQWECNDDNKMEYNYEEKVYKKTILLKQGYYNYFYAFAENGSKNTDIAFWEGNAFEAENDYQIIVYYRPFDSRHDRIISYMELNSLK